MTSIAGVDIGNGNPCRIVAEMSNAHNGSLERALRIIEAVAEAGADFIKFQCYRPGELVALRGDGPAPDPWGSDGWTMLDLYEKAQTPHAWFPALVGKCEEVGIPWFSSVFGLASLALLEALRCPAYKIAALDARSEFATELTELRQAGGEPIVASSRMDQLWGADLTLWCPPGYPQVWDVADVSFRLDGLSYHGTDWRVPCAAALEGASMVECHVQIDDDPSELEANVSLNMTDLAKLTEAARLVSR